MKPKNQIAEIEGYQCRECGKLVIQNYNNALPYNLKGLCPDCFILEDRK